MGRKVAIVGTGQTKHKARQTEMNIVEMIHQAVTRCLEDSGLKINDVDAVLIGNMEHFEGINLSDMWAADAAGSMGRFGMKITTGGSSGTSLAMASYYYAASGLFDTVLCIGWQKQSEGDTTAGLISATDAVWERESFAGAFGTFGCWATEYMKINPGITPEHAARVSVKNHKNGCKNQYSHLQMKISVEDVLNSKMMAYPVRLLDLCPASEGACALIFAEEEKAKKITDKPAWVAALASRHDSPYVGDVPGLRDLRTLRSAVKEAFPKAGIMDPIKDIDVIELYEPTSWAELSFLEAMGIGVGGKVADLLDKGVTEIDGELPVNPSGGVICTNPIGATAMIRVAEAAMQIRGQCGEHQIPNVKTAVATGYGGNSWSDLMILKKSLN